MTPNPMGPGLAVTVGVSRLGKDGGVPNSPSVEPEITDRATRSARSGSPRGLMLSIAVVLAILGTLKLAMLLLDAGSVLNEVDPFLHVSNRALVWVFGPLEIVLAGAWLIPGWRRRALWSSLLLGVGFLLHYILAGSINSTYVCPCLGAIFVLLPGLKILQRFLLLSVIVWIVGACVYLAWLDSESGALGPVPSRHT